MDDTCISFIKTFQHVETSSADAMPGAKYFPDVFFGKLSFKRSIKLPINKNMKLIHTKYLLLLWCYMGFFKIQNT